MEHLSFVEVKRRRMMSRMANAEYYAALSYEGESGDRPKKNRRIKNPIQFPCIGPFNYHSIIVLII